MKEKIAIAIIWVLIIADFLTGLLFNLQFDFYRIGLIVKVFVTAFAFFFYLHLLKDRNISSMYLAMVILFLIWSVGAYISYLNNSEFKLIDSVVVLNRYLFFFVLSCVFLSVINSESFTKRIGKILDLFFTVNNMLILVGFIFSINLFSSYNGQGIIEYTPRFGYKGLIFGNNEIAGIYTLGIAYYFRENFKYRRRKSILLILTCIATVLTGAKGALLSLIIISIYFLYKYRPLLLTLTIVPALALTSYFISVKWGYLKEKYLSFMVEKFHTMDLITFIASGRDLFLFRNFSFVSSDWNVINYFMGDAFLYSETDLFDLYFFFGLGAILYLYVYIKIFFIKDRSSDNIYVFLTLMAIAFTAGHIILSAIVPLFLLLYIFSAKILKANDPIRNNRTN